MVLFVKNRMSDICGYYFKIIIDLDLCKIAERDLTLMILKRKKLKLRLDNSAGNCKVQAFYI